MDTGLLKMEWVITRDYLFDKGFDDPHKDTFVGWSRREDGRMVKIDRSSIKNIAVDLPTQFRLTDDDGYVYVHGRMRDMDTLDAAQAFDPQDWMQPRSGYTATQYRAAGLKANGPCSGQL